MRAISLPQAHIFQLLEYITMELCFVPASELTNVGLLLLNKE